MSLFNPVKELIKRLLYTPLGVHCETGARFRRPWWIHNPDRIRIGAASTIGRFCVLNAVTSYEGVSLPGKIEIGRGTYIGGFCQIHAMGLVQIGDGCVLSEHVYMSDIAHGFDMDAGPIMKQPLESKGPVLIGNRVFIGYGCSVLPGVSLGDNCIVGTRSVVTKSFPSGSMIAGSPAKLIKTYNEATKQWVST